MKLTWRSELAQVFTAAMEAAWLSPVLLAIAYAIGEPRVALVGLPLWLLLYVARLLARWMAGEQMDLGRSRVLIIYLAAASLLLALKLQNYPGASWLSAAWLGRLAVDMTNLSPAVGSVMLTVGTVIYCWWRGLQVAQQGSHPMYLFRQFEIGLVAVMVSSFLASRMGLAGIFLPWVFWFFFWGLLAVAVNRLEDIAHQRRAALETYWLPILFAISTLVVVAGGALSVVYSRQVIAILRSLLEPVGRFLDLVIYIIAVPLGFLVQLLIILLRPILAPLLQRVLARLQMLQQPVSPLQDLLQEQERQPLHLPGPLQEVMKWLLIILIAYVLFRLLARTLRRRAALSVDDVDEVHESVWVKGELGATLRALWLRLLARLGLGPKKATPAPAAPASSEERAAHSIRQVYQRLMEMAAGLGRPRPPAATPYEYLDDLDAILPASHSDLIAITEAYISARYGGSAARQDDVDAVQQAWQRVRAEGAQVKSAQTKESRARHGPRISDA